MKRVKDEETTNNFNTFFTLLSASDSINNREALTINEDCTITMDGNFEGTRTSYT